MKSVTIPLKLEFNRPFVELEFRREDGGLRKAWAWIDTGGGSFLLTEALSRDLGLELEDKIVEDDGQQLAKTSPPEPYISDQILDLSEARIFTLLGETRIQQGFPAEAFIPAHVLMRYHVVFDYPAHSLTLALANSLQPRGVAIPASIQPETGFPRVELEIAGRSYGFLLDTGAAYTMISEALLEGIETAQGAVGYANMSGSPYEVEAKLARLDVQFGGFSLRRIGVVSRKIGVFERWMSPMMTAPIVGALAGNVLKAFRLEIDYANQTVYLEQSGHLDTNDLDSVGLTLRPENYGRYTVIGVSNRSATQTREQIHPGDGLLKVDDREVGGSSFAEAVDNLRGRPGTLTRLALARGGQELTVCVPVVQIL